MTDTMPGYLGAGSVLILDKSLSFADDDILDATMIDQEWISVGHIYGGIRSILPHVFWINNGTESAASSTIYQVAIRKKNTLSSTSSFSKKDRLEARRKGNRSSTKTLTEMNTRLLVFH